VAIFTDKELEYLAAQQLGRLATARTDGTLQNSPVTFGWNAATETIDVGGHRMGTTQKFRNVAAGSNVALVVDDVVSESPWQVRCLEIRGTAEAIDAPDDSAAPVGSGPIIRIHPARIISWGIDPTGDAPAKRNV
jgi:pyridoxamine 5'-phosphate oxidase family protein